MAQLQQLGVAERELHLGAFLALRLVKRVFVAAGRDVGQRHAGLYPALQIEVDVHILGGPVVHHPHYGVAAADAVNAPETLDDADGVPVDVVVDHGIAVLQVLALGYAVGGDEQV